MKKLIMFSMLYGLLPLMSVAQDDDMYFVPTKENLKKEVASYGVPDRTYYVGSQRSIDEYNRRNMNSPYAVDSLGNPIIDFSASQGTLSDSVLAEMSDDYRYTRQMSRFDDYSPSVAYWEGYRDGSWSSPWRLSWYSWYDDWYYPWHASWYYSGWYGWHSPWYYSSWYYPRYYGWRDYYGWTSYHVGGRHYYGGGTGRGYSRPNRTYTSGSGSNLGGYRSQSSRTYRSQNGTSRTTINNNTTTSSRNLGGSRAYGNTGSNSGSFGSSGSFGGSRSVSTGGGGGFSGSGRSTGGGRSYGGRR